MPRIASVLLLFVVACAALATDYRLSINAPADQLAKAKALHIYGFKFAKGDRVVSVSAGKQVAGTGYRVTLDSSGATGTMVADQHAVEGFAGKVLTATGQAPEKSVSVSVDKIVPAAAETREGGILAMVKGFATSTPGYVTFACLAVLAIVAFLILRPKSATGETWSLPNRRKSIDESLKDITKRLEQIDESQRNLVRKPPVLRSFRNQIDNFDARLKHLEGQLGSIQGLVVKTGESLGALDRGQSDLKAHAESSDVNVKGLFASIDSAKQSVSDLNTALEQLGKDQVARSDEVLSNYGKQALDILSRLAGIEKSHQEAAKGHAELHQASKHISERIDHLKQGGESLHQSLKQVGEELAKVHASVDESAAKEIDFSPVQSEIAELRVLAGSLQSEQSGVAEQLAGLTAKEIDFGPVQSSIASLQSAAEALQKKQIELAEKLAALAAKEVDFAPVKSELAELRAVAESLKEDQGKLATEVAAAAAKEVDFAPVQSDLAELRGIAESLKEDQGKLADEIGALAAKEIDLAPVQTGIGELQASIEALQKEQIASGERLAALGKELESTQAKTLEHAFQELAKANEEAKAAMVRSAEQAFNGDDKKRLLSLSDQQAKIEAGLADLRGKLDKLEIPSPAKDLAELAAQQKQHAEALKKLSEQLNKLQDASGQSAAAIEAKIADVSARTDQRESILLSLQSRVSESEGQSDGASEVLPVIADLRLELQSLAADQAKVGATLDGLSQAISKVGANSDSNVQALIEDQAKLASALNEIGRSLEELHVEAGAKPEGPAFDEARFQASFDALAASLAQWKSEAEASQRALEERLASAVASADGVQIPPPAFDEARFQASFDALSASLAQWKSEAEASQKAIEERLASAVASTDGLSIPAPAFDEARFQASFDALSASLAQWKSEAEASQKALEERLASAAAGADGLSIPAPAF
ncbi:MAG: hypothetical protein ACHQ50_01255, partial [Fimbriimonadales bacterium]